MSRMMSNLYNGHFSDSDAFRTYLERRFVAHHTKEEDKSWVRDWLSETWNAALDEAFGEELTKEERIERARVIDDFRVKLEEAQP